MISRLEGQVFKGIVKDANTKESIPFANINLPDLNTGLVADINGVFELQNYPTQIAHFNITFLGYETKFLDIDLSQIHELTIFLTPSHIKLEEVVVSIPGGKLTKENIVLIERKSFIELTQTGASTLAEAISKVPGVNQRTTGTGIGKPVIRGLSGNRIITYAQGIRMENQQWGEEHGLGVGSVGIGNVEIIKGPASLLYGSDALGGILYFVDEPYAKYKHTEGYIHSQFRSNTIGIENSAGLKINNGDLKVNLFGGYNSNVDYRLPDGNRVGNTRYSEKNIKTSIGYTTTSWITNFRYSLLNNNFGIFDEEIAASTSRSSRLPFQLINNHSVSWENIIFTGKSKIHSVIGYTGNFRQEYEDVKDIAALDMHLNSYTYNVKWHSPLIKEKVNLILGSQGMHQTNENNGEELLIPDGTTSDFGMFTMANLNLKNWVFQTGIRYDFRSINASEYIEDQNLIFPSFENNFQNFNYSFGTSITSGKYKIRANLSSGFRAPNTSELLSNGVHEGTNQYVLGNQELKSENAIQIDFSLDHEDEHLDFYINGFYNNIDDYIFLSPRGDLIENAFVYEYLQRDANLYGGESGIHIHPHGIHWLHIQSDLSVVFGEYNDDEKLPLIPAPKLNNIFRANLDNKNILGIKSLYLEHTYIMNQDRVANNEFSSESYQLFNTGLDIEVINGNSTVDINLGINNLFNKKYIDHLSRLKPFVVPNPGRNIYLGLKWTFDKGQ